MAGPICLNFPAAPAIAPAYLKILLARNRRVCGDRDSTALPITYPHVIATPLHLAMIACEAFPVSLLGVVHTRNRIIQNRPLHVDGAGQIRAWLEGHRETARGQELDL